MVRVSHVLGFLKVCVRMPVLHRVGLTRLLLHRLRYVYASPPQPIPTSREEVNETGEVEGGQPLAIDIGDVLQSGHLYPSRTSHTRTEHSEHRQLLVLGEVHTHRRELGQVYPSRLSLTPTRQIHCHQIVERALPDADRLQALDIYA